MNWTHVLGFNRRRLSVVAVVAGLLVLAASAQARPQSVPSISLALGAYDLSSTPIYVAQRKGFFKKAGVDVRIQQLGTAIVTEVIGGRADLTQTGPTAALNVSAQGKPAVLVFGLQHGVPQGVVVAKDAPFQKITDLSGKKVGVIYPGSSIYGLGATLSDYVKQQTGTGFSLYITQNASGNDPGDVLTGIVDAHVATFDQAAPYIQQGKLRWLISPFSPTTKQVFPSNTLGYSFWGLKDNLDKKAVAVSRMIAGVRLAIDWMKTHSDKQVAAIMSSIPGYNLIPSIYLLNSAHNNRAFITTTGGNISQKEYALTQPLWAKYGLTIDIMSPSLSYAKVVDMSFWNKSRTVYNKLRSKKKK